jgi:hypothetical protein
MLTGLWHLEKGVQHIGWGRELRLLRLLEGYLKLEAALSQPRRGA